MRITVADCAKCVTAALTERIAGAVSTLPTPGSGAITVVRYRHKAVASCVDTLAKTLVAPVVAAANATPEDRTTTGSRPRRNAEHRPDEVVIVKQYASAFFGTSLAATLTAARIDTAVIAGVSTSGCVRASATDAMQHGFRPIVIAEACGDRTPAIHTANVTDLQAKYADIATIAEATAHFTAEAAGLPPLRGSPGKTAHDAIWYS